MKLRTLAKIVLAGGALLAASGCGGGNGNSGDSGFSIELMPGSIAAQSGQSFDTTLTITSDTGAYSGEMVQVDVLQELTTVIGELMEGNVNGAVDTFMGIDPEMSGLGMTWKRMTWQLGSDMPSRQRRMTWLCTSGVERVYVFVEINGKQTNAPSGTTWKQAKSWGVLDPHTQDVVTQELALSDDSQLEVLPIGCGEEPPPPPPPPKPPGGDGGTGPGPRETPGTGFTQWGMAADGTAYYVTDDAPTKMYWWSPDDTTTLISEGTEIETAMGESGPFSFFELTVTQGGAAGVRVKGGTRDCYLLAQQTAWTPILCIGDEIEPGAPIDRMGNLAVQASSDSLEPFDAQLLVRFPVVGGLPEGSFQNLIITNGGTSSATYDTTMVELVDELPDLADPTDQRLVSTMDNVFLGDNAAGLRGRAIDYTVAAYVIGESVLAWADLSQSGGPIGDPAPASGVSGASYSFDNQPIGGLTTDNQGDVAFVAKYIDTTGAQLLGSGLYIATAAGDPISKVIDFSKGLPIDGSLYPVSQWMGLPAVEYALADDGTFLIAAWVEGIVGDICGIWQAGTATKPLFVCGDPAPGRTPGSTLGTDIVVSAIGAMLTSSDGMVAFSAVLGGPGIDSTNDGALIVIDRQGRPILMAQLGDDAVINGNTFPIDTIDLQSQAIRVPVPPPPSGPPWSADFFSTATRDTHVVFGSGTDGRGASFGTAGCGELIYRVLSFAHTRDSVLRIDPVPCN